MATITVQFAHPQVTVNRQLTVPDAKLLEFADLLIAASTDETPPTRQEAIQQWGDKLLDASKDRYRRLKYDVDLGAIVEADITA